MSAWYYTGVVGSKAAGKERKNITDDETMNATDSSRLAGALQTHMCVQGSHRQGHVKGVALRTPML
jgi:hypothetical protein